MKKTILFFTNKWKHRINLFVNPAKPRRRRAQHHHTDIQKLLIAPDALAQGEDPNEGRGMTQKTCYNSNGVAIGAKCVSSASHTDICHYQYNQWGKCD